MNATHYQHLVIAVILQMVIGITTGNWWAGAMAGSFFFIGREHAQAEYRWIDAYGDGKRASMPDWAAFSPKVWKLDSLLDFLVPAGAVCIIAIIL